MVKVIFAIILLVYLQINHYFEIFFRVFSYAFSLKEICVVLLMVIFFESFIHKRFKKALAFVGLVHYLY